MRVGSVSGPRAWGAGTLLAASRRRPPGPLRFGAAARSEHLCRTTKRGVPRHGTAGPSPGRVCTPPAVRSACAVPPGKAARRPGSGLRRLTPGGRPPWAPCPECDRAGGGGGQEWAASPACSGDSRACGETHTGGELRDGGVRLVVGPSVHLGTQEEGPAGKRSRPEGTCGPCCPKDPGVRDKGAAWPGARGAGQGGEAAGVFRWASRGFPATCGGRLWETTPEKHVLEVLPPRGLSSSPRKGAGLDGRQGSLGPSRLQAASAPWRGQAGRLPGDPTQPCLPAPRPRPCLPVSTAQDTTRRGQWPQHLSCGRCGGGSRRPLLRLTTLLPPRPPAACHVPAPGPRPPPYGVGGLALTAAAAPASASARCLPPRAPRSQNESLR